MNKGLEVKIAETHGVAMRSGSAHSQIRFGGGEFGPLIPAHRADAILRKLLEQTGILTFPGSFYGTESGYLRFSYSATSEDVAAAIDALRTKL